jgi:hypothetical protein
MNANRGAVRPGALEGAQIDVGRRMMAFNWLPAAYAHADWLGPWAELLGNRESVSMRTLQRASLALLERHDLRVRYLRDVGHHGWLLQSHRQVMVCAHVLGTAMLGGWVKGRLERTEVTQQQKVLGTEGRQAALRYAHGLRALPVAPALAGWPVEMKGPESVTQLGVSCMAALLDDTAEGARERFTLRFAYGAVTALALTRQQVHEATALIENTPYETEAPK